MKQNLWKHALFVTVLVLAGAITFNTAISAPPPVKVIVQTTCCENGVFRGYSNDCSAGEGNCVNHFCAAGQTEVQGLCL